jgi:hypothetical protein
MKEETRKRRSLLYAFHNARIRSLSHVEKVEPPDDGDDESTNFSISTDLRYPPSIVMDPPPPPENRHVHSDSTSNNDTTVTTGASLTTPPPPPLSSFRARDPPVTTTTMSDTASVRTSRSLQSMRTSRSSRSVRSTKSTMRSVGNRSRMSLDQYLEEKTQASSLMTGPMMMAMMTTTTNLGELPADFDAMSVGTSASLDVSFHGEYPQLVLTPSVDGTASRMTGNSSLETNTGAVSITTTSLQRSHKKHNALVTVRTSETTIPLAPSASSSRSVGSFDTTQRNVTCTPEWLNENIDRVWKQFDQCKADPDGRYAPDDDPYDSHYENNEVDDHLPYNKAEPPAVNEYRYQFRNGHISDLKRDDSGVDDANIIQVNSIGSLDFESTEEEEHTDDDDDVNAILDATTTDDDDDDDDDSGDDEEKKDEYERDIATRTTEKDDQFSFRSFSPFDDMGWSFSAGSTTGGGKSISKMIETEVIYPILKPICELVEATEIPPPGRTYHHQHRHRRLPNSGSFTSLSSSSPPPPSSSLDMHKYHKNSSYRMSPRRYKSQSTLR